MFVFLGNVFGDRMFISYLCGYLDVERSIGENEYLSIAHGMYLTGVDYVFVRMIPVSDEDLLLTEDIHLILDFFFYNCFNESL